jgi:hypothetical protein
MSAITTLPATWAIFVENVCLGADPTLVARDLGLDSPRKAAMTLLRHPTVRKALAEAAEARLYGVSVPLALDTVDEILQDKTAPKSVRAKLALGVLARAQPKGDAASPPSKNLGDMTPKELEQLVAQLSASGVRPGEMRDVTPKSEGDAQDDS